MLNVKGLDHLNLNVISLKETVDWYEELFGFQVKEEGLSSSGNPYKIIGLPGVLYLALYENGEDKVDANPLNHFGLNLDNFDEALSVLKKKGIDIHYGGVIDYDNSRSAYISDPNGLEIELSSNFGGGLN